MNLKFYCNWQALNILQLNERNEALLLVANIYGSHESTYILYNHAVLSNEARVS